MQEHWVGAHSKEMTAVLLAGGMGTRLRSVLPSKPKPLANVGSRSFLELLIRQLQHQGVHRLLLCTGYLGDQIEAAVGNGEEFGIAITYSRESSPMGTAGAISLARRYLESLTHFLVLNGDSFLEIDFNEFIQFHQQHGGLASLAVRHVENAGRYGAVEVNGEGRVTRFMEKGSSGEPGLVNAGVYLFSTRILKYFDEGPASLEYDVFPRLLSEGIFAFQEEGLFIDIGTPEDYVRAQGIWQRLYDAAGRS